MSVPVDSSVYYHGVYWNSYPTVVRHLNRRAFDDPDGSWFDVVRDEHGGPYRRGVSLNCGVGWVERALIDAGAVKEIVALDYMDDLLQQARDASSGYPIEFRQADTNDVELPPDTFDLAINHAGLHHVTKIDAVVRRLWHALAPSGTFVMWDYTGPHRNQYPSRIWDAAHAVNATLPAGCRSDMRYPHLPTMLVDDPTEAVHSELILDTVARYFRPRHFRRLGGPIAYLLLTHNEHLFEAPADVQEEAIAAVLAADVDHITRYPGDSLFTFGIYDPRDAADFDPDQLCQWTHDEAAREAAGAERGGVYYASTPIAEAVYEEEAAALAPEPAPLQAIDVAALGPRFAASALLRAVVLRAPVLLPAARALNRARRGLIGIVRRSARAGARPSSVPTAD